jgi:hypothetical protein
MLNYAFSADSVDAALVEKLLSSLGRSTAGNSALTVQAALVAAGCATPAGVRALMWLWKFGLVEIVPSADPGP